MCWIRVRGPKSEVRGPRSRNGVCPPPREPARRSVPDPDEVGRRREKAGAAEHKSLLLRPELQRGAQPGSLPGEARQAQAKACVDGWSRAAEARLRRRRLFPLPESLPGVACRIPTKAGEGGRRRGAAKPGGTITHQGTKTQAAPGAAGGGHSGRSCHRSDQRTVRAVTTVRRRRR